MLRTPAFDGEFGIVVGGNIISSQGQIIVLVGKTNINPCRTGLTMITIDTGSGDGVRCKGADYGIVFFPVGGVQKLQNLVQMGHSLNTGQGSQHAGTPAFPGIQGKTSCKKGSADIQWECIM